MRMRERNEIDIKERSRIQTYIEYVLIALCLVVAMSLLIKLTISERLAGFSLTELFLGEVSNTLFVVSIVTVLSSKAGTIYWVDVQQWKLIQPKWLSMSAIVTYLVTYLACSVIGNVGHFVALVQSAFFMSVITLLVLTYRMLDIYFGREKMKSRLQLEYLILYVRSAALNQPNMSTAVHQLLDIYQKNPSSLSRRQRDEIKAYLDAKASYKNDPTGYDQVRHVYKQQIHQIRLSLGEKTFVALGERNYSAIYENLSLLKSVGDQNTLRDLMRIILDENVRLGKELFDSEICEGVNLSNLADMVVHSYDNTELKRDSRYFFLRHMKVDNRAYKQLVSALDDLYSNLAPYQRKVEDKALLESYESLISQDGIVVGMHYKPVQELYRSYMSGALDLFDVYERYLEIEYDNTKDFVFKKAFINYVDGEYYFDFLTDDEYKKIQTILEKDKSLGLLSQTQREFLSTMKEIRH